MTQKIRLSENIIKFKPYLAMEYRYVAFIPAYALAVMANELDTNNTTDSRQMESLTIAPMVKKYSILLCFVISLILIVKASLVYPGGSLFDKNAIGFDWSKNFLSNLFAAKAINGSENPGRIWAIIGMAFHSVGYGIFFIRMSKKIPSGSWATILKWIGVTNIVFIFLIATPLHDVGTISIILTLLGLFSITVFVLKSKLHFLKFGCIICLLTFYGFFFLFGFGYLSGAVIMQKVYNACAILLVLGLEYFTQYEDFLPIKSGEQKTEATSR